MTHSANAGIMPVRIPVQTPDPHDPALNARAEQELPRSIETVLATLPLFEQARNECVARPRNFARQGLSFGRQGRHANYLHSAPAPSRQSRSTLFAGPFPSDTAPGRSDLADGTAD